MARAARIYYTNCFYHICIRGNNRQNILLDPEDKEIFLACLGKFKKRFEFKLFGFVVMHNHVHLIIGTGKINISKIMQAITLSYSNRFRKKYSYTGYVWQGRFRSNVIESESYILQSIEYAHYNPVRAGIVNDPADYVWSSYLCYYPERQNGRPKIDLVSVDKLDAAVSCGDSSFIN